MGKEITRSGKVVVFATSFLDELMTSPADAGEGRRILDELVEQSAGGVQVEYRCERDRAQPMTAEELAGARAVIADLETYDAPLLSRVGRTAGGELELIVRYGVGYDAVDLDAATEAGVRVANTPGANTRPTAEWAVATILDIAGRRIPHHERASRGLPKAGPSRLDVSGRTLGIVGTGAIGTTVAELMSGFGMRVLACDPEPKGAWAAERGIAYVPLHSLLEEADFVTIHASANREIIGREQLSLMKPTSALINCARGVHVDSRAAYAAVKEGRLFGYGLDEVWPYPELPLEGLNITTTPHVGSDTDAGKAGMQRLSAEAVAAFFRGEEPPYLLNTVAGGS